MSIPTLPTDNLYKFMALAGLAAAVACFYLAASLQQEFARTYWNHITEYKLFELKLANERSALSRIDQELSTLESDVDHEVEEPQTESAAVLQLKDRLSRLRVRTGETFTNYTELLAEGVSGEQDHIWLSAQKADVNKRSLALTILAGVCLFASVAGFWLWYFRVQRPLDREIAKAWRDQP